MPKSKRTHKTAPKSPAYLLAEYSAFPSDQPVDEKYASARLQKSRAWMQLRRVSGGGPKFHRTPSGRVYYRKADIERYLAQTLSAFDSTSQYPQTA